MMLTPELFVGEPPWTYREIRSPGGAVFIGALLLGASVFGAREAYRRVGARTPVVEMSPDGLKLSLEGSPTRRLQWREVESAEVERTPQAKHLNVTTSGGLVVVQHDQVGASLERVLLAISEYKSAHAPQAS
jgi:hypothetical protein